MKKTALALSLFILTLKGFSQDKVFKLTGESLDVNVKKVTETEIEFVYPGEEVIQVLSKKQISKILYKSGREEILSSKIEIKGEEDWEKVILTNVEGDVAGLNKVSQVEGKHAILYGGQAKLRKVAQEKIKREAAKIGAHVVFIQKDNFEFTPINNVSIVGIAYKY